MYFEDLNLLLFEMHVKFPSIILVTPKYACVTSLDKINMFRRPHMEEINLDVLYHRVMILCKFKNLLIKMTLNRITSNVYIRFRTVALHYVIKNGYRQYLHGMGSLNSNIIHLLGQWSTYFYQHKNSVYTFVYLLFLKLMWKNVLETGLL